MAEFEMLIDQFQYIKIPTLQQGKDGTLEGTLDASGFLCRFRSWLRLKKVTRRLVGLRSTKLLVAREKKLVVPRVILQGIKQKKCIIHC